jgi:phosphatidylethanolamine-binding protein (PEBP) family uncharacterized protein
MIHSMIRRSAVLVFSFCALFSMSRITSAEDLDYTCSEPPLKVTFAVEGGHYSGEVNRGNLFIQSDISKAPVVQWKKADPGKLYTLLMIDFDGNANGSWPDPVPSGENSPVRHWIVGNIPGKLLRTTGYIEPAIGSGNQKIAVLQPYRAPHIPVVSDRYGLYLFEQAKEIDFEKVTGPITNFDHKKFLGAYHLDDPVASNFFVAIYTSESPFSGKAFKGNDVSKTWHKDHGKGQLTP